jgi:transposase
MNKYSGIDLHSNNCVVVVSDEEGRVCCERRVPNDFAKRDSPLNDHTQ